jgi:hypothetical protein
MRYHIKTYPSSLDLIPYVVSDFIKLNLNITLISKHILLIFRPRLSIYFSFSVRLLVILVF